MSTPTLPNDAITRIPLLQRVFLYSTTKLSVLTSFAAVHSSWQDCVHNYSHGIFATWVSPTRATLDDLAAKKVQGMIDDFNNQREKMGFAANSFDRVSSLIPNSSSSSSGDDPSRLAIHRALHFLASQAMSQDESAIRNFADDPGLLLESVRDTRLREVKRSLSGGLVRGCQFGFFWLVVNILESPSPFAQNDPSHGIFLLPSSEPAANVQQNLLGVDHLTQFDVPLYNDKHFIVDPVKCTFYSGTPIFAAVSGGHHDVVRYLVAKTRGAVICKKIMQHHHPHHPSTTEAHCNNHEGDDEGDNNNNDEDDDEDKITSNDHKTEQQEGEEEANSAKAEMVLEYVLDLNERTPLFNALAIDAEMMEILLEAGCDHRILDYAGDDIVNVCASNGYLTSLKWLLDVRFPQLKMVELAMNPVSNGEPPQGATVNYRKNNTKVTDKQKAEDEIVDPNRIFWNSYPDEFKKRTRALDNAAAMGRAKTVEYLVGDDVGCIVSPATLQSAARSGSAECVRLVLDAMKKSEGVAFVSTDLTSVKRVVEFASVSTQKDVLLEMLDEAKTEFPKYARKSTEFQDSRLFGDDNGGNCCGL